jgi:hypothetical protein
MLWVTTVDTRHIWQENESTHLVQVLAVGTLSQSRGEDAEQTTPHLRTHLIAMVES